MRIHLIRHGRQSDTRCNVDVDLSDAGRAQADLAGVRLAALGGIDALYSSDMIRARETAEIVSGRLGLPVRVIPSLRELDFGDMEGLTDDEIDERFADFKAEQALMASDLHYPGGESIGELLDRVFAGLVEVAADGHRCVAIATHGVVIRALVTHLLGAPLQHWRLVATSLENGSLTEIEWDPTARRGSVERLNDFAHLDAHPELLRSAWGIREN